MRQKKAKRKLEKDLASALQGYDSFEVHVPKCTCPGGHGDLVSVVAHHRSQGCFLLHFI